MTLLFIGLALALIMSAVTLFFLYLVGLAVNENGDFAKWNN